MKVEERQNDAANPSNCAEEASHVRHEVKAAVHYAKVVLSIEGHFESDCVPKLVIVGDLSVRLSHQLPAVDVLLRQATNVELVVVEQHGCSLQFVDVVNSA